MDNNSKKTGKKLEIVVGIAVAVAGLMIFAKQKTEKPLNPAQQFETGATAPLKLQTLLPTNPNELYKQGQDFILLGGANYNPQNLSVQADGSVHKNFDNSTKIVLGGSTQTKTDLEIVWDKNAVEQPFTVFLQKSASDTPPPLITPAPPTPTQPKKLLPSVGVANTQQQQQNPSTQYSWQRNPFGISNNFF